MFSNVIHLNIRYKAIIFYLNNCLINTNIIYIKLILFTIIMTSHYNYWIKSSTEFTVVNTCDHCFFQELLVVQLYLVGMVVLVKSPILLHNTDVTVLRVSMALGPHWYSVGFAPSSPARWKKPGWRMKIVLRQKYIF